MNIIHPQQSGVAALLIVVVLSAATLLLALSSAFLGIGELDLGFTSSSGGEALSIADGCMEEAYRQLRLDQSYTGASLSVVNGSCTITVSDIGGGQRTIMVTGTHDVYNKKISSTITLTQNVVTDGSLWDLSVDSWEEVDT